MLKLNAYSGRDIQNTLGILKQLNQNKNMTIEEGIGLLQKELIAFIQLRGGSNKDEIKVGKRIKKIKCPSCKKGYLLPTPNYEGLNIVSCKKCRYSTILEEEIENG